MISFNFEEIYSLRGCWWFLLHSLSLNRVFFFSSSWRIIKKGYITKKEAIYKFYFFLNIFNTRKCASLVYRLGAANSINIRFIIFDCYVKRELNSFIPERGGLIPFIIDSILRTSMRYKLVCLKIYWDSSRAFIKWIDFNQFDIFLMTYRAILRVMVTLRIGLRECLKFKEKLLHFTALNNSCLFMQMPL